MTGCAPRCLLRRWRNWTLQVLLQVLRTCRGTVAGVAHFSADSPWKTHSFPSVIPRMVHDVPAMFGAEIACHDVPALDAAGAPASGRSAYTPKFALPAPHTTSRRWVPGPQYSRSAAHSAVVRGSHTRYVGRGSLSEGIRAASKPCLTAGQLLQWPGCEGRADTTAGEALPWALTYISES